MAVGMDVPLYRSSCMYSEQLWLSIGRLMLVALGIR